MLKKFYISVIVLFCLSVFQMNAQKQMIDTTTYKNWKLIESPNMSDDGVWVTYTFSNLEPGEENNDSNYYVLFNTQNQKELKLTDVNQLKFFNNGKWLRYEKQINGQPTTVLHCLKTNEKIHWVRPVYFQDSEYSPVLNYSYIPEDEGYEGRRFVLYNIETKDSVCFENLIAYSLLPDQSSVVYIQAKGDSANLVYKKTANEARVIYAAPKNELAQFSLSNTKTEGTFILKGTDDHGNGYNKYLYEFTLDTDLPVRRINFDAVPMPMEGYAMEQSTFSTHGKNVIFPYLYSTKRPQRPTNPQHKLGINIWKWNEGAMDRRMRMLRGDTKKEFKPEFAYLIHENKWVQLTHNVGEIVVKPDAGECKYVFTIDPSPYLVDLDWTYSQLNDLYLVNTYTGERTLIKERTYDVPQWNTNGEKAVMFNSDKKCWEVIKITNGEVQFVDVSKDIPYPVYDEDFDQPGILPSYGLAAWLNQGQTMVVYDRYDLWAIDLEKNRKPVCITHKYGRKHKVQLRFLQSDYNGDFNNEKEVALFNGFDEKNKAKGIYLLNQGKVVAIVNGNFNAKIVRVSQDMKSALWFQQGYGQSPDLYLGTISSPSKAIRVTNVNPQQEKLNWGSNQVVTWKNDDGEKCEGLLYLPDGYDSKKTYPMIVTFYEKRSKNRFEFKYPQYCTSTMNIPSYVSQGYIVFEPDISFKIGHPAESSFNAVVSGTKEMIKRGYADAKHIGIHGHSFGGYQVGHIITKTNMFTCALPASLVTNLTSNYASYRSLGLSNMFKYESEQMRMGKPMHEDLAAYVDASSLFHAKDVETPVLIFHCDNDHAVPFTEGLGYFLELRRLKKPAWLINYKGEGHSLKNMDARKDWTTRMQSFFDYYLKDKEEPEWMK